MASVDKVRIGSSLYSISPSGNGTLNGVSSPLNPDPFVSEDSTSPTSWSSTNPISTSDKQASIFSKVTTMVKNVRWLYAKLGTTDYSATGPTVSKALSNLQNRKAANVHSHSTNDLPVSNQQVNSDAYIPTSSLVYSMNETLGGIGSKFTMGSDVTTNIACGGIASGTQISGSTKLTDVVKDMLYSPQPSTEYESISLGTWSSTSDVDTFFRQHTPANGFAGIKLGNYVTINDGTYNTQWEVAGFNLENNATASDGTTYDNGKGILMIPKTQITTSKWHGSYSSATSYINSLMHTSTLVTAATNMRNILGSHMISRNVLLGSSNSGTSPRKWTTNAYTWTTSYLTLMSIGQMNGTFKANCNQYDDGEANYYLPLFSHENYYTGSTFWSRCVWGGTNYRYYAWFVGSVGSIYYDRVDFTCGVRPLMLLR